MDGSTECLGGLLLLLGLYSRFASVALIGVMCVAYATAESEALHAIFSDPDKFVSADPFLFLYASVLVFAFGPGKFSIDALARKDSHA
jgi:putative oxidoreductase